MKGRLLKLSLLVLMNFVLYMASTAESTTAKGSNQNSINFIKSSCRATRYPDVCVQTLVGYATVINQNEQKLAMTALTVSISRTQSSASFMKKFSKVKRIKPREYSAVQDCKVNMDSSMDRLNKSVKEIGLLGKAKGEDLVWHISNVQTWVSAALTDQNTCVDNFSSPHMDRNLKAAIGAKVVGVSQVTSNALALVNNFASKHR